MSTFDELNGDPNDLDYCKNVMQTYFETHRVGNGECNTVFGDFIPY